MKIDNLIQFVLGLADQEEDYRERALGPIHLVKYVYLADLIFSECKGETYTGVEWKFHHFGPWSLEIFSRIDPALTEIGAIKKALPSSYSDDDYYRYTVSPGTNQERLERVIPAVISGRIKQLVHQFTCDTPALLNHVYLTRPMLEAAPGENLDLSIVYKPRPSVETRQDQTVQEPLSGNAARRRAQTIKDIKSRVQNRIAEKVRSKKGYPPGYSPPRHDDVYEEGVLWLESLAGEPVKEFKGEVNFSPDIWKSPSRHDPEIS